MEKEERKKQIEEEIKKITKLREDLRYKKLFEIRIRLY